MPRAFFGTFFRRERKYYPLRGGSPSIRAVVGASNPHREKEAASAGAAKGFLLALWKLSGTEADENPMRRQLPLRVGVDASNPADGLPYGQGGTYCCLQWAPLGANNRRRPY